MVGFVDDDEVRFEQVEAPTESKNASNVNVKPRLIKSTRSDETMADTPSLERLRYLGDQLSSVRQE